MRELLLVIGLSLAFRTFNLLSLPMFVDEGTYLYWGLDIWDQRTRAALMMPVVEDGKQPLYMWLAGGATYMFSDPLLAGRMVSALAGVMSAIGIYLSGTWLVGRSVGLLAGILYAVVPFNLFYDRTALVEALLNAAGIWAFSSSVYMVSRTGSIRNSVLVGLGVGIALGAALWTKMSGLFFLPLPFLCALLLYRQGRFTVMAWGLAAAASTLASLAALLFLAPQAGNLFDKAQGFSEFPQSLLDLPFDAWAGSSQRYWTWFHTYLPEPLWMLVLVSLVWGLVRRTRLTLLLVSCWGSFTLAVLLLSRADMLQSRYVSQGVFPILLLLATMLVAAWMAFFARVERARSWIPGQTLGRQIAFTVLLLALLAPTLWFDARLLTSPETAPLAPTDYALFMTDVTSGYGFREAMEIVRERSKELTREGRPIIVLGNYYYGQTYAGLRIYLRGIPGVHQYVDSHLAREAEQFLAAWRSHGVPILIMGNDGWDRLDDFERGVPQARRLGYFAKPGGRSSYRVYEIDVADLTP